MIRQILEEKKRLSAPYIARKHWPRNTDHHGVAFSAKCRDLTRNTGQVLRGSKGKEGGKTLCRAESVRSEVGSTTEGYRAEGVALWRGVCACILKQCTSATCSCIPGSASRRPCVCIVRFCEEGEKKRCGVTNVLMMVFSAIYLNMIMPQKFQTMPLLVYITWSTVPNAWYLT
jgi:hypothetical protein